MQLRGVIVEFYSVDTLSEAKVRLLSDVDTMQLTRKLPYIHITAVQSFSRVCQVTSTVREPVDWKDREGAKASSKGEVMTEKKR